jgi:heme exporter protein D
MNWSEFFHMGGYAFYVWTSWVLTIIVFAWHLIQVKIVRHNLKESLSRELKREQLDSSSANTNRSNHN